MGSQVGGEAPDRWLTRASPRSPASAWSSSSPNALYPSSSLSPHRMADGGSPFLGRRDFVYPSSTRGENQILLLFSPRRPPLSPPLLQIRWCPCRGGRKVTEPLCSHCFCPGQGGGSRAPSQSCPPRHGLPKLRQCFSTDPSDPGGSPARKEEKKVRGVGWGWGDHQGQGARRAWGGSL